MIPHDPKKAMGLGVFIGTTNEKLRHRSEEAQEFSDKAWAVIGCIIFGVPLVMLAFFSQFVFIALLIAGLIVAAVAYENRDRPAPKAKPEPLARKEPPMTRKQPPMTRKAD